MKHDKVLVIPERLAQLVPNNPNKLPWNKSEAYIGVPLFSEGKCIAHFSMIWSDEGAVTRPKLSWAFIEMFMHSLEDMILQRLLHGKILARRPPQTQPIPARVIPLDAITASQSLKPYARSLSHELRTPMQGIVGMLDIMHSTVIDAIEDRRIVAEKAVFEELKANIEVVLESSRRAVEAADNVVHAYDLNLQMPDTPLVTEWVAGEDFGLEVDDETSPDTTMTISCVTGKRDRSEELDYHPGPPLKRLAAMTEGGLRRAYRPPMMRTARGTPDLPDILPEECPTDDVLLVQNLSKKSISNSPRLTPMLASPTQRPIIIRDFMRVLVDDILKGCHPVQKVSATTELGEVITVRREGLRGELSDLNINLVTEPDVPTILFVSEQHLLFALQKVIDNAIKFTENGTITISLKLVRQLIEIRITDTGCGMTEESKSYIFKPHFQEDASIRRSRDGLGLSLFNAKAHVRKNLGGDMTLERSTTSGPMKGSEFLIRLPIHPSAETPVLEPLSRDSPPTTPGSVTPDVPINNFFMPPSPQTVSFSTTSKRVPFNPALARHVPLNILIAEDNVINSKILVGYLRKLGYPPSCIHLAYDGREAVAKYQRSLREADRRRRINVVLMDLWMPNMDGYEATEKILELDREWRIRRRGDIVDCNEDRRELKVIAVTADVTSESLDRARRTGMHGFMAKPYKVLDVEHLIVEHFRKDMQAA